ncbi:peptide-methionine (S)-S-oxide reductase MsrA [Porticoccus sp. W117]|uniref:peptide-methionine (S)-S-oxide reductase MsrA n=1 Tax=Porticoccus sp. W117 TaxID=3054777 RepID=UPI002591AD7C|nr:peptide-methionine (S)-S-oxide reductase MsrA [Porticoccus sp. W117]MDM3871141.1 peptide-methionine (S)-S-oxide reductase MsrA [Porticoccus sp. W117]
MENDRHKQQMVSASSALPGRTTAVAVPDEHYVTGNDMQTPFPLGIEQAMFAMGPFWLPEFLYWQQDGIYATAVGYAGGYTPNPNAEEVASSQTGHTEVVLVAFDSSEISYRRLLKIFWECHNPTQGMRQGEHVGTQYRSAIFCFDNDQLQQAEESLAHYQKRLAEKGFGDITTAVEMAPEFYYAEAEQQQYLAKNPDCDIELDGTGVKIQWG